MAALARGVTVHGNRLTRKFVSSELPPARAAMSSRRSVLADQLTGHARCGLARGVRSPGLRTHCAELPGDRRGKPLASPADARETLPRAARDGGHRAIAGKLSVSWSPVSRTARSDGGPSLFGDSGAPWRAQHFALPVPLGDRRSSILGDPTARGLPETPPESPSTASDPGRGVRGQVSVA